jgi:hypothetical protein
MVEVLEIVVSAAHADVVRDLFNHRRSTRR